MISLTFGRTDPVIVIADPIKPMEPIVLIYKYAQEHFDRVAFVLLDEASDGFTVITNSGDEFHQLVRKLLTPQAALLATNKIASVIRPVRRTKATSGLLRKGTSPGSP